MKNYVSNYKVSGNANSSSFKRFAQSIESEKNTKVHNEKPEFDGGYAKGVIKFAVANKFMKLGSCGLDTYASDDGFFWKLDGDSIYRVESDLSWVDSFLEEKNANS
ncbi:MAG: hypothetical protein AABY22_35180 [Nanoarchaeota archaeon]